MKGLAGRTSRAVALASVLLLSVASLWGAEAHSARGIVTEIAKSQKSFVVSCEPIPGYMDAMEMPFAVRDPKMLQTIRPGITVVFNFVEDNHVLYADHIQAGSAADFGDEQMEAGGLTALEAALDPSSAGKIVQPGEKVPDFALVDQAGNTIHLSSLRGKVVLLTFGYSRCPNPDYCLRLSNNLGAVEKRFAARAGRDLVLLTIAIDPEHDQGAVLKEYAGAFDADPAIWHFLTGPLPAVKSVAAAFGMNFWPEEGFLTHSLHTAVLDRNGILVANIEGNKFTARQLGDLVQTVMNRPR
jgi:protein SCO1/2